MNRQADTFKTVNQFIRNGELSGAGARQTGELRRSCHGNDGFQNSMPQAYNAANLTGGFGNTLNDKTMNF